MDRRTVLALLAAVTVLLVGQPVLADERLMIAVGNNIGGPEEAPLRFAEADARRVRDLFVSLGRVDRARGALLAGGDRNRLRAALAEAGRQAAELRRQGREVTFIFYYAGHGDGQSLHLGRTAVRREQLLQWIDALPASLRIVIFDACRDGSGQRRGVRRGGSFDVYVNEGAAARGTVVISSAAEGEAAQESDRLGGALFTHYLVSGLRGAADGDGDGRVTLSEAYAHAYRRTVRRTGAGTPAVQHPDFAFDVQGAGDLVLTVPSQSRASLVLPPGRDQRYLLYRLPSGAVVAEVGSSPAAPVRIAAPAGRLLIQRRSRGTYGVLEISLRNGQRREIAAEEFRAVPYEEVARRGGQFDLHPWTIGLGVAGQVVSLAGEAIWLLGPELSLSRRLGRLLLAAKGGLDFSRFQAVYHDVFEMALRAELLLGVWFQAGRATVQLRLGPRLVLPRQRIKHRRSAALERVGFSGEQVRWSTSLGGVLDGGVTLSLGRGASLAFWLRGFVGARELSDGESSSWRPVPGAGFAISFGWSP
jgi:hypothetical protein